MDGVKASIDSLKKAALKSKVDPNVRLEIDQISAFFGLLETSLPSIGITAKLIQVFRKRLSDLYNAILEPALQLAASTFILLSLKLSIASSSGDKDALGAWGEVQRSIVSGAMDFLESTRKPEAKNAMGAAFLKPICDFYLPEIGMAADNISASLKRSVYGLLEELSMSSSIAQQLRNPQILGGKRLGVTLLQTNDYLTFETLLNLFVRLLQVKTGLSGSTTTAQYISEVFVASLPSHLEVGREIERTLTTISLNEWERTVMKITDVLARSRVEFPQPFEVDEVQIGHRGFPQTGPLDRLFVDATSFLVNVDEPERGAYDVLRAPFANISRIVVKWKNTAAQLPVVIEMHKPAILGVSPFDDGEGTGISPMTFNLDSSSYERFVTALRARKLGHLIAQTPRSISKKVSLSTVPLIFGKLSSDDQGDIEEVGKTDTPPAPNVLKNSFRTNNKPATRSRHPAIVLPALPTTTSVSSDVEAQSRAPLEDIFVGTRSKENTRPNLRAVPRSPSIKLLSSSPRPQLISSELNDKPSLMGDSTTALRRPGTPPQATPRSPSTAPRTRAQSRKRKRDGEDVIEDGPSETSTQRPPIKKVRLEEAPKSMPRPKKPVGASSSRRNRKNVHTLPHGPSQTIEPDLAADPSRPDTLLPRNQPECKCELSFQPKTAAEIGALDTGGRLGSSVKRKDKSEMNARIIANTDHSNTETTQPEDRVIADRPCGANETEKATSNAGNVVEEHNNDAKTFKGISFDPSTDGTSPFEIGEDVTLIEFEDIIVPGMKERDLFKDMISQSSTKLGSSDPVLRSLEISKLARPIKNRLSRPFSSPLRRRTPISPKASRKACDPQCDPNAVILHRSTAKSEGSIPSTNSTRRHSSRRKDNMQPRPKPVQASFHDRIMHLLSEINAVVVRNIERRVDGTMKKARIARDNIISQGTADLEEMRLKRIEHYDNLVDLENEYAAYRRKLVNSLEGCHKITQEGVETLTQIIRDHDRKSLPGQLPPSLFPTLPSFLAKPMFD